MGELLTLQLGRCGNRTGCAFWETICGEHRVGLDGVQKEASTADQGNLNICFAEGHAGRYHPRAILVDLEPSTLDDIRSTDKKDLFRPDSYMSATVGTGGNWARGYYECGGGIIESFMDSVRREVEGCEYIQGFQLIHSIGGGTGSGLGALVLSKIREEYGGKLLTSVCNSIPPDSTESAMEIYNWVLGMPSLIEHSDACIVFDNEALSKYGHKSALDEASDYYHENQLMANTTAGFIAGPRFSGQLNTSMRKIIMNLTPFPRPHFFLAGFSSVETHDERGCGAALNPVSAILNGLYDKNNVMASCNFSNGICLGASLIFRGKVSMWEVEKHVTDLVERESERFAYWIPNSTNLSACDVPSFGHILSSTLLANSTCIHNLFGNVIARYTKLYARRAFFHNLTGEGLQETDLLWSETNISDLISEYQQPEGYPAFLEPEDEDGDEGEIAD